MNKPSNLKVEYGLYHRGDLDSEYTGKSKSEILKHIYYEKCEYGTVLGEYSLKEITKDYSTGLSNVKEIDILKEMEVYWIIKLKNKQKEIRYWSFDEEEHSGFAVETEEEAMRYFSFEDANKVCKNINSGSSYTDAVIIRFPEEAVIISCKQCDNFDLGLMKCHLSVKTYKYMAHILCDDFTYAATTEGTINFNNGSSITIPKRPKNAMLSVHKLREGTTVGDIFDNIQDVSGGVPVYQMPDEDYQAEEASTPDLPTFFEKLD